MEGETIDALEKGHFGSAMSLEVISELAGSKGLHLDLRRYEELKSLKVVGAECLSLPSIIIFSL